MLIVKAAHREDDQDEARVAVAMADELRRLAGWLDLVDIEVVRKGNLAEALERQM